MDTLVIGYGKIGRIKSFIWRSLGREVYVYDTQEYKIEQARTDGFHAHKDSHPYTSDLIVDISTPASHHLKSLQWILEHVTPQPRNVLIEKPLASDEKELKSFRELFREEGLRDLSKKIAINESYYLSSALVFLAQDILNKGSIILSIHAEFSKNRLQDIINGRFVDAHLGSFGIELPHMIAMLQKLGVSLDSLSIQSVLIHQDSNIPHNEGFNITCASGHTSIVLKSYLGNFKFNDLGEITRNDSVVRTLKVKTNDCDYIVEFDPVHALDRYKARVNIYDNLLDSLRVVILDDNHLTENLIKIHKYYENDAQNLFLAADNALEISQYICTLYKMAKYKNIQVLWGDEMSTITQICDRSFAETVMVGH